MNKVIAVLLWSGVLLSMSPEEKGGVFIAALDAQIAKNLFRKKLFSVFHNVVDAAFKEADIKKIEQYSHCFKKRIAHAFAFMVQQGMVRGEGVISVSDLGQLFLESTKLEPEPLKPIDLPLPRKITIRDILPPASQDEGLYQQKDDLVFKKKVVRGSSLPMLVQRPKNS